MKTIENRKRRTSTGGVTYFMKRTMPNGKAFFYSLHLSPGELAAGRCYVAHRVWKARENMRQSIVEEMRHAAPRS